MMQHVLTIKEVPLLIETSLKIYEDKFLLGDWSYPLLLSMAQNYV